MCRLLRPSVSACGARDVSYSLFHSVGKVLFSKSDADADAIIDRCAADEAALLSFVHSNYTAHLPRDRDMELTASVAHTFSVADDIAQAHQSATMGDVTSAPHHSTPHISAHRAERDEW